MEKTLPLHSTKQQRRFSLMNDEMFTKYKIPLILLYYGLASSTLIVINKLAVHNVKAPVFILMCQLLFAAISVKGSAVAGVVDAEKLQWSLIKPFIWIIFGFLGTLYANIQVIAAIIMLFCSLELSPIDTSQTEKASQGSGCQGTVGSLAEVLHMTPPVWRQSEKACTNPSCVCY
jgi:hypothetical protein